MSCLFLAACFDDHSESFRNPLNNESFQNLLDETKANSIRVFNRGCCFIIWDFKLICLYENGNKQILMAWEDLSYKDLAEVSLSLDQDGPFTLLVAFDYDYNETEKGRTEFPILHCDGAQQLNSAGLLLVIGDAEISLKTGNYETVFWYEDSPWRDGFVPTVAA